VTLDVKIKRDDLLLGKLVATPPVRLTSSSLTHLEGATGCSIANLNPN
jgi:hypothetical protein